MSAINMPRSTLARLGARWGKATVQIMSANVAAQVIGLFTAIFLTYFMSISQYGRYALAVFYASLLTHIINSGLLQGAFLTVFGAGGDDDDGDGGDDDNESALINAEWFDRRRFLTTSLVATLLIGCFWVAVSMAFARPLSDLLFRSPGHSELVILAAVSGALGGVWRYAVNLLRVERRIMTYCICRTTRSIFVLIAIAILMPMNRNSIRAALLALIIGTVASLIPILAITLRSYKLSVHPWDFAIAFRNGLPYIPITLFSGFVHSAGVYLLAGFRGPGVVGEFSVASSMSSINAHYVSGFLSSFSPIKRTSVFFAARDEGDQYRHGLVSLFAATALWLFVGIALLAPELVKVLPDRYQAAAHFVPYAMLGWTAYGFYMVTYRLSEMDHKRKIYVSVSVLSAATVRRPEPPARPDVGRRRSGRGDGRHLRGAGLNRAVLLAARRGPAAGQLRTDRPGCGSDWGVDSRASCASPRRSRPGSWRSSWRASSCSGRCRCCAVSCRGEW